MIPVDTLLRQYELLLVERIRGDVSQPMRQALQATLQEVRKHLQLQQKDPMGTRVDRMFTEMQRFEMRYLTQMQHLRDEITATASYMLRLTRRLADLRQWIADDAKAAEYQSLGQYRSAVIVHLDAVLKDK